MVCWNQALDVINVIIKICMNHDCFAYSKWLLIALRCNIKIYAGVNILRKTEMEYRLSILRYDMMILCSYIREFYIQYEVRIEVLPVADEAIMIRLTMI
jgi:hypothetical protein